VSPFVIPDDWPRYRAIDFGFNNPFVCLWGALSPDNVWYIYQEHYRAQDTLAHHYDKIAHLSQNRKYVQTYADHDAQDRAEFKALGLFTKAAKKDVRNGIECVQRALKVQANGKPRLHVFDTCPHVMSEMASYHYPEGTDLKDPNDEPVKVNDHTVDALRYMLYSTERKSVGYYSGRDRGAA
jgi:phage terminase large subunit